MALKGSASSDQSLFWEKRECLYRTATIQVDRAQVLGTQESVILKSLRSLYPSLLQIEQLKHEFAIGRLCEESGESEETGESGEMPSSVVLKVLDLKYENNRPVLVLEYMEGLSLRHWLEEEVSTTGMMLDDFWSIATQLITGLNHIHGCNVIHKDIKPDNILIAPDTLQIKIADFSIAIAQSQELITPINPTQLEGTLAYLAPEQTGRMNRVVDYRSDFYSLGVVFYELISGHLPFQQDDPLNLIHDHLTRLPEPLQREDLPTGLNEIIFKLLAKNAEDRYQSLQGLQQDLEACRSGIPFQVGASDRSSRLNLPQKLYGRETEVQQLLAAFDRVATGHHECIFVSGYSGIGKSALVNQIHTPITGAKGSWIVGKFDQLQRSEPYSALLQALRSLLRQILLVPEAELQGWRDRLQAVEKQSGSVLRSVLPEWAVLFPPESIVETTATISPTQFNRALQSLLESCAVVEHPLVMFLDDLQWADSASLDVLESLLTQASCPYFLLIGAYRDNEVTAIHPLTRMIDRIPVETLTSLVLQPLSPIDIREFIQDLVTIPHAVSQVSHSETAALAELLHTQTQGNPFFLTQLLKTLHQDRLFQFDRSCDRWVWELDEIRQGMQLKGDIIDLMMANLQKLPANTLQILKWASCLGAQFTGEDLATIAKIDRSMVIDTLSSALAAGLIFPIKGDASFRYRFLHDRVQQAAYELIPLDDRPHRHGTIARQLVSASVFEQVHHYNLAIETLTDLQEQHHVAQLNLKAGRQARQSAAYQSAYTYLSLAKSLLPENPWEYDFSLTQAILSALAEASFLCSHWQDTQHYLDQVTQQSIPLLDRIPLLELQIDLCIAQGQQRDAIDLGLRAIEQIGITLERPTTDFTHLPTLPEFEALPHFKVMDNPQHLAAIRILSRLAPITYQVTPEIYPQVARTLLQLCLQYGHSSLAAFVYGAYSAFLQSIVGDASQAYHSGQIALKLLEQFPDKNLEVKVYMVVGTYALPCKQALSKTLPTLLKGIQSGLESGNLPHMGLSVMAYCTHLLFSGQPIAKIHPELDQYSQLLQRYQQRPHQNYINVLVSFIQALKGSNTVDLISIQTQFETAKNYQGQFMMQWVAALEDCLFNRDRSAFDRLQSVRTLKKSALGLVSLTRFYFYAALSAIAIGESATADITSLRQWASHAPENYQHLVELLEAELAAAAGQDLEAMALYDQAIDRAETQNLLQDLALFYERAGLFYHRRGRLKIARTYILEAYYAYDRFGAIAKCLALATTYPEWIQSWQVVTSPKGHHATVVGLSSGNPFMVDAIDVATLMKASETIAMEVRLPNLITTLLKVLTENTGAQKVALILEKSAEQLPRESDRWAVEAVYPETASSSVPMRLIEYGLRLQEWVLYHDARSDAQALSDPYVQQVQPRSILIVPIQYQGRLLGSVYLENQAVGDTFTEQRVQSVKLLMSQAAIAIENAKLYQKEQEKSQELELSIDRLKQSQAQLVQSEKIASLGQLVAGVAHEINNPISFISVNLEYAQNYIQKLFQHLQLLYEAFPTLPKPIQEHGESIDLAYLLEDLPKILNSMDVGIDRIQGIMQSLRNFSRRDSDHPTPLEIHQGLDTTLMILAHRLKANELRPAIQIVKQYGDLPALKGYGGQMNQVFMNLLANAIDALNESNLGKSYQSIAQAPNCITITTENLGDQVRITIDDNGPGIPIEVQTQIFSPFFTTKPEGKGTGLGLSISHQIITTRHSGSLSCANRPEGGTRFEIRLPIQVP